MSQVWRFLGYCTADLQTVDYTEQTIRNLRHFISLDSDTPHNILLIRLTGRRLHDGARPRLFCGRGRHHVGARRSRRRRRRRRLHRDVQQVKFDCPSHLQGVPSARRPCLGGLWFGWSTILPPCQILIRPSRIGETVEHSKSKSTQPSPRADGTPCTCMSE